VQNGAQQRFGSGGQSTQAGPRRGTIPHRRRLDNAHIVSAPTNLTGIMIGERIADWVREEAD